MAFPLVSRAQYDQALAEIAILRAADGVHGTVSRTKYDEALLRIASLQEEATANLERIVALAGENLRLKETIEDLRAKLAGNAPAEDSPRPDVRKILTIAARERARQKA